MLKVVANSVDVSRSQTNRSISKQAYSIPKTIRFRPREPP